MELAKVLFDSIKESTLAYKEKNKNTSVVKLLDKAISSLDKAVKAMDTFLKRKGIDMGKLYDEGKKSSKGLIERAKEAMEKSKSSEGGLFNSLKDKGLEVGSSLLEKFGKFKTSGTEPPSEEKEETPIEEAVKQKSGKGKRKKNPYNNPVIQDIKVTKKNKTKEEDIAPLVEESVNGNSNGIIALLTSKLTKLANHINDLKGDPEEDRKQTMWDKWKERQDRRKREVEEEKGRFGKKGKDTKEGGWLGKILGMGSMIVGGIGTATKFLVSSMLTRLAPAIVTGIVKGMGTILTSLVPGLSKGLARTTGGLIGKGLRGGVKLAARGGLALAKGALPLLGKAAMLAGRGALMLASGPVGWGIAAGTAIYGAWRFYKYMTRNDINDNIYGKLTRLRLLSYGYNDNNKEHYSKLFELEMILKENLKFEGVTGKLAISRPTDKQLEKIYELFSIDVENGQHKELFNKWFSYRFIPAYHAYIVALWKVNSNIYTDSLESLNPANIERFLANYVIPTQALQVTMIPFFDQPKSTVQQKDLETIIAVIRNENKDKLPKDRPKAEERMEKELKEQRTKEQQEKARATADKISDTAVNTALTNAGMAPVRKPITGANLLTVPTGVEGEPKPQDGPVGVLAPTPTTVSNTTLASGPLVKGGTDLTGITTNLKKEAILNLDPDVFALFTGMAKEYHSLTGKTINVNDGFRSRAEQEAVFKKYGPGRAARPGRSLHEYGLAIDIPGKVSRELDKMGLLRKYGFTASVGGEDWHIEPIGVALNVEKAKTDLEFRQQAIKASIGKGGGGYGFLPNAKKYGRDIAYQRAIYESSSQPADPKVVASLSSEKPPTGQTTTSGPVSESTTNANPTIANTPSINNTVEQSATPSMMMKTAANSTVDSPEGETKPTQTTGTIPSTGGYGGSVANTTTTGETIAGTSPTMNLSNYGQLSPVDAVKQAAKMTGMDEETLLTFAKVESSLKPAVKNKNSSATGLFQITGPTWKGLIKQHGHKYGIPADADRADPLYNALMAAEYAKDNLKQVAGHEKLGLSKAVALYLTHHFGPSGGKKILNGLATNPNTPMQNLVSQDSYNSNRAALSGKTAKTYIDSLNTKFSIAANTPVEAYNNGKSGSSSPATTMVASATTPPPTQPTAPSVSPTISNSAGYGGSTSSDSGEFMKAGYTPSVQPPKPTLSNSAYDITKTEIPIKSQTTTTPSITPNIDFSSVEGIMNQQLSALTQIATLISNIDSKLDIEKIAKLLSVPSKETLSKPNLPPKMQTVPSTGVDLTRRTLT